MTGAANGVRIVEVGADLLRNRHSRLGLELHERSKAVLEVQATLRKPDRMDMGANQLFVGDVNTGRGDRSGHHLLLPLEEVLVVRAAGGAVRDHDSRLAAPAGATGALGVVGRGGGNIAKIDGVEIGDVDAELHRRRTEHER